MNVKRFLAPDMRRAISQVRAVHGPDAVILSSRSVGDGVEIIAAIDYDPQLLSSLTGVVTESADSKMESAACVATSDIDVEAEAEAGANAKSQAHADSGTPSPNGSAPAPALQTPASAARTMAPVASEAARPDASASVEAKSASTGPADTDEPALIATGTVRPDPAIATLEQELRSLKGLLREQFARLSWADMKHFEPERAMLLRRTEAAGIAPALAETLVGEVAQTDVPERAWREVLYALARRVQVLREDPLEREGAIALVGPTGVGKTTTIAKLAARHCLRFGSDSLALITTDNFRVGAQRQLDAFGAILGIPVRRADSGEELSALLEEYRARRLVLIDTAGIAPRDDRLDVVLGPLAAAAGLRRFLVLSAGQQESVMRDALAGFGRHGLSGVVLTKLDEAPGLGAALSALVDAQLPVAWLSEGQRVPEDLTLARVPKLIAWAARVPAESLADDDTGASAGRPSVCTSEIVARGAAERGGVIDQGDVIDAVA